MIPESTQIMNKKFILIPLISILLAGCALPQSSKIITGGTVETNMTENTIQIENYTYNPSDLNVKGGTTISITNNDDVAHTVTADDKSFDTGKIDPGQTVKLTVPPKDGTFGFYCIPHPYMRGNMVVSNSPKPTP